MLTLTLVGFAIFILYIITSVLMFGIPASISETYYLFESRKRNLGSVFTIMMFSLVFLLISPFLEITPDNWQFLAFLSVTGIAFVGAAPLFKKKGLENIIHTYGAISAAVFSLIWIFVCYPSSWDSIMHAIIIVLILSLLFSRRLYYSKLFWVEMVMFLSIFLSIIKILS